MVTLLFSLGFRCDEALGLRWKDVDFKSESVTIAQLMTRSSQRTLGMDEFLQAALIRQHERQAGWMAACGEAVEGNASGSE